MEPIRLPPGEFLGGIVHAMDAVDLKLRETIHSKSQSIPLHAHEAPHFCFGIEGECTERINGRHVQCGPGTLEFHPAGTAHSSRWSDSGGRCFTVTLGSTWIERIDSLDAIDRPFEGMLPPASRQLVRRLHRELLAAPSVSPLVLEGLTLTLLGESARKAVNVRFRKPPAWLTVAEEYLRDNALESVRADDAARVAGVHPVVLARWFRRVHGCTTGEFVRRLRIDRAANMVARSMLPLSRIAQDCGFADHAHFTRTFRREMHMSPSEYRRRLR